MRALSRGWVKFGVLALLLWSLPGALPAPAKQPKQLDIADTIVANPIMSKFAALLQASDLATFLSSRGPFTIFAPTDSAFSKLPPGTMEALLLPQNKERLQKIILIHVINGKRFYVKDLQTMTTAPSCEGTPLKLKRNRFGTQLVLDAKLTHGDIRCQNGLIHQIDTLLMPPASSLPALVPAPVDASAPAATPSTNAPSSVE